MNFKESDPAIRQAVEKGLIAAPEKKAKTPRAKRPPKVTAPALRWTLDITLPLKTVSAANAREHWAARHRRVADERMAVRLGFSGQNVMNPPCFDSVVVKFTRLGGRRLDDDNLRSAMKGVRDAVAEWLQVDDGSDVAVWEYGQEPGGPFGVRIQITAEG